jgi:SAM-dependent methyltransferase
MNRSRVRHPTVAERQAKELESWQKSEAIREPLLYLVASLSKSAPTLLGLLDRHTGIFEQATDVLELGAGQGWASCIVKRRFPDARVIATDISADAIANVPTWERVFDVKLDEARVGKSYETGLPDSSIDVVFAFASAHHFVLHARTFKEMARVLRPGGAALYLHEPSVRSWAYPIARARMRRTRTDVYEDALNQELTLSLARAAGLRAQMDLSPTLIGRGPLGVLYNGLLIAVPPLRRVAWCTANFCFTKPNQDGARAVERDSEHD